MEEKKVIEISNEIMHSAEVVYLTTIDTYGFPYTRAVFNLRNAEKFPSLAGLFEKHRDDLLIYLSTNTSSAKVGQLQANSKLSVYYCIPDNFYGLMLAGEVESVTDPEIKKTLWQNGWEMYFPAGTGDPDYTVLSLTPLLIRGWYGSEAFEIDMRNLS